MFRVAVSLRSRHLSAMPAGVLMSSDNYAERDMPSCPTPTTASFRGSPPPSGDWEVASGTLRVAPLAPRRPTRLMSSITEDDQQRLLEHYAVGLRGILAEHDDLTDPALTAKMRALRDDAPVRLEHRFWGAQFLAMAFGHELGFAAAHPPALRAIFNLGVVAAENGLVPFQAMRSAHGQLARLGVLRCDRVDPIPQPRGPAYTYQF